MPTAAKQTVKQFKANLPTDILAFLGEEAQRFGSSVNSEITRAVRERMDRVSIAAGSVSQAISPAATGNTCGLAPAGNVNHG